MPREGVSRMDVATDITTEKIARAFSSHRFDLALPNLADDICWTIVGTAPMIGRKAVKKAIERISGTLQGRKGSFVLQHSGLMTRGESQLTITVVPDSGTDELAGIGGTMSIKIADGKHWYEFVYTLAEVP